MNIQHAGIAGDQLYRARVTVLEFGDSGVDGPTELWNRFVRFSPPGWLTVADDLTEDSAVQVYPASRVLRVDIEGLGKKQAPQPPTVEARTLGDF
jgi:hypothetical protein